MFFIRKPKQTFCAASVRAGNDIRNGGNDLKVTAFAPWFGSKRTLAPRIVEALGPHKAYIEPFCGSMAVLLAKPACAFEIVNDLHGDLINLAWTVQHEREGPRLYRRLRRTLYNQSIFEHAKLALDVLPLADKPEDVCPETVERAYLYFILCWIGRSGILGTKSYNNCFTVRYTANGGNQATRFAAAVDSIPSWRKRLRRTTILRQDGLALLEKLPDEKGTAIYCDPPYLVKNASYEHDFEDAHHTRLASVLSRFVQARVVVSYYAHPKLAELYPGWQQIDCSRAKHLAVQGQRGSDGKVAPEVLLINGADPASAPYLFTSIMEMPTP